MHTVGPRHGLSLVEGVLQAAIEAGQIPAQPTRPLAHVLLGATDEAVLFIARADDQEAARAEMLAILLRMLESLRS